MSLLALSHQAVLRATCLPTLFFTRHCDTHLLFIRHCDTQFIFTSHCDTHCLFGLASWPPIVEGVVGARAGSQRWWGIGSRAGALLSILVRGGLVFQPLCMPKPVSKD